ncbi:MAG: gamma-glutamyltransferase, partial [Bacteroidota bacterium]
MKKRFPFLLIILIFGSFACKQAPVPPNYDIQKSVVSDSAMVVSPHPLASEVGVDILKQGGNAVDATVAVQFALAVVYPRAGNIGGGGFMVFRQSDGSIDAIDYREKAPGAASRDMYLDAEKNIIKGLSTKGHLASGVPGSVDGLIQAHEKYGSLDFKTVIQPAIDLARNGFKITTTEANRFNSFKEAFSEYNTDDSPFIRNGEWMAGHMLVQTNLANTLERIRDQGRDGFYAGETADYIAAEMARGNGIISKQDLADYQAQWREPITRLYKDYKIISMPPSSSGGVALLQLMEMVEQYPLAE